MKKVTKIWFCVLGNERLSKHFTRKNARTYANAFNGVRGTLIERCKVISVNFTEGK